MKLFYYPAACSLAVHIALVEAGLDHTITAIDRDKKTGDGRDFMEINPKGCIPTLETEDHTVLTENQVILAYVAARSGKLLPEDDLLQWRVREALAYMSSEIHGAYAPFFRNFPEPEKARAREKLIRGFSILSDQMGDGAFLVGDTMSIADCYLFWAMMAAGKFDMDLPANLQAHFERMKTRPSVRVALEREGVS